MDTYQIMRQEMEIGGKPQQFQLPGNQEISSATIDYRKVGAVTPPKDLRRFCRADGSGSAAFRLETRESPSGRDGCTSTSRWSAFAIIFFFAVTGLTLNHQQWFANQQKTVQYKGRIDPQWLTGNVAAKLEIVEYLRSHHNISRSRKRVPCSTTARWRSHSKVRDMRPLYSSTGSPAFTTSRRPEWVLPPS